MICTYCKTPLPDGAELPFDCECGANLTLNWSDLDVTLRDLLAAARANGCSLTFRPVQIETIDEVL